MQIKYVGPSKSVQIAETGQVCVRGETVDVKAQTARNLLKQDSWEKVEEKKEPENGVN